MQFEDFCTALRLTPEARRILALYYDEALKNVNAGPEFLTPEFVEKYYPLCGGPGDALPLLLETLAVLQDSPAGRLYCRILYYGFFVDSRRGAELGKLPPLDAAFGDRAGLLNLLAVLGAVPQVIAKFRAMGLPDRYALDALRWLGGTIGIYATAHGGMPGHDLLQSSWCRRYIEGELFRIGRLEYLLHPYPEWAPAVYRHRESGHTVALCRDGWKLTADGFRTADPAALTAALAIGRDKIAGTPISPLGHAETGRTVELDPAVYLPVAAPWETVPSIHIPAGGGMTGEAVMASFRDAVEFFARYFHFRPKLFVSTSWIFNPDLEAELPDSNFARFMRLLYLSPAAPSKGLDGLYFIYGRADENWSAYPEETSLHRALHNIRRAGRKLKSGVMFVLTDDLPALHPGFYRKPKI